MTTAGNVLVMIGTQLPNEDAVELLLGDNWRIYYPSALAGDPCSMWYAVKLADGTEGEYTLGFEPPSCPATNQGYVVVVELSGATLTPLAATDTQTSPAFGDITFGGVGALGQCAVFACAVSMAGAEDFTTGPAGYAELDRFTFDACPNHEFILWYSTEPGGTVTPGDAAGVDARWRSLELVIHAYSANLAELGLIDLVPFGVGSPVSDGTDVGDIVPPRLPDEFPLPPEPTGIIVPGPTWEEP